MIQEIVMHRMARVGLIVAREAGYAAIGLLVVGFAAFGQAQSTASIKTHTTLSADLQDSEEKGGRTVANFRATVLGEDGSAATGTISLLESGREVAGAALDAQGAAVLRLDSLTAGDHSIRAVYHPTVQAATTAESSTTYGVSQSAVVTVHPQVTGSPDFGLAIAPATLTVKAGTAGASVLTITPQNGFTGFLSLSCSGLPVGATCTYTPANVQVTASSKTVTADLSLLTTGPSGTAAKNHKPTMDSATRSPLVLAVLLPGVFAFGLLGRKRRLLGRFSLLAMIGLVSVLGMTACAPRYRYYNHGPPYNGGTPTGAYTITVTAQTSNGVTATEHSTPLALTVQ